MLALQAAIILYSKSKSLSEKEKDDVTSLIVTVPPPLPSFSQSSGLTAKPQPQVNSDTHESEVMSVLPKNSHSEFASTLSFVIDTRNTSR